MATTDEQKKAILPFLQRADEIGKVEPKVAYYCRLYAIQQGLALETRSPQIDGVLKALLSKLEKEKTTITLGEGDSQYCENFAITVFTRADRVDRAGHADKNTAMTFYAASIFFEILNQFKTLEADLVDMQRYAAWKAADIRKALREGRTSTPGAPGDDPSAISAASGDMGMPSVSQSQNGNDMPAAPGRGDSAAPSFPSDEQAQTAPRFRAGSRVLYNNAGLSVKGTVAKPNATGQGSDYMVALSDRIVTAPDASLAPDLEAGDSVLYQAKGEETPATVVGMDASVWPPSYAVVLENGAQMTASHTQLTVLQHVSTTQTSRRQSLDEPASQQATVATQGNASQPSNVISAPLPPAFPTNQHSNAGSPPSTPLLQPPPPPQQASRPQSYAEPQTGTFEVPQATAGFQPTMSSISEAQKLAKYAASSLGFEDVNTAVKQLTDALKLLTQPGAGSASK
ncbi:TPA: hypothetical protein ACH3X1_012751 [Trebouxia sp. C0004]